MAGERAVWIADTSAILAVVDRGQQFRLEEQTKIFLDLDQLVEAERLVYPKQVLKELERASDSEPTYVDLARDWARRNEAKATRYGESYEKIKELFERHPQLRRLTKHDITSGEEDADPFVLELAVRLREQGEDVAVLTEDYREYPDKLPLASGCGIVRIPSLRMKPFLVEQGVWKNPEAAQIVPPS